jgi:gamma-glutamyl hercynylcysteine S-oxide synthase
VDEARAKLHGVLADVRASLDERLHAGAELGRLGDPRATAIDRVLVAAGPFLSGGYDAGEEGGSEPARVVHLSTFRIDRHPVTVAAYAQFIAAGGYRERRWWSRAGWAFRAREAIDRPRFWGEAEWTAYLAPNLPVVGVSAHEAEAYASFRGGRLPTEAEWEKACRGTDGRRYPWGDTWIDDACGMRDVGPRGTVPIGSYPRGVSPYGVHEMVGCVWQWCADVADEDADPGDEDPFVDPDGYDEDAERVTRGGGWNNLRWSLSCTSRNGYPPGARFSNLGFRCVVEG